MRVEKSQQYINEKHKEGNMYDFFTKERGQKMAYSTIIKKS